MVSPVADGTASEKNMIDEFLRLSDAGCSVIQLQTREPLRAVMALRRKLASNDNFTYAEWDTVNGIRRFNTETVEGLSVQGSKPDSVNPFTALKVPLDEYRDQKSPQHTAQGRTHVYTFINMHPWVNNDPRLAHLIEQYAAFGVNTEFCVILITPPEPLTLIPSGVVTVIELKVPTPHELHATVERMLRSIVGAGKKLPLSDLEIESVTRMGLGMTRAAFETYTALAVADATLSDQRDIEVEDIIESVRKGKVEIVKQSDVLELFHTERMSSVGGMHALKRWIKERELAFSDEAREFGVVQPKGIFLVGVPGTGKSLAAKAIAGALGRPLLRLDFGRVYGKYVGTSEQRIRQALDMVNDMGEVVLFADEIDKGLGGSGGEDGGVSSRVLGTFLTWMQESGTRAFVIMTANRVEGLPPELYRKGRIDETFACLLPTRTERREVLQVHIEKRKHDFEFTEAELNRFDHASDGFVPAEIEAVVSSALLTAFNADADRLGMDHIVSALKATKPMSVTNKTKIDTIINWATDNAISVSDPEKTVAETLEPGQESAAPRRRLGRRS